MLSLPSAEVPRLGRNRSPDPLASFSSPPRALAAALSTEIEAAFEFCRTCHQSITFFGGARVKESDPLFAEGMRWGEAVTLMNLAAAHGVSRLLEAQASELFSAEACRAAWGAVCGVAAGRLGPLRLGKALGRVGGLYGPTALAAALADLDGPARELLRAVCTTGAGPGMMEAVPLGVLEARKKLARLFPELAGELSVLGRTQGSRIQLEFEQRTSPTIEHLRTFAHFLPRRLALTEHAAGFVVFPGGFGTLNELFEVLRAGRPVALHGRDFWGELAGHLQKSWQERGLADPEDIARLVVTDSIEEGLRHLLQAGGRQPRPQPTAERARQMPDDVVRGLDTLSRLPAAVTFIGGHHLSGAHRELGLAERMAWQLSAQGCAVRIGGDGALLDKVSAGVRRARRHPPVQALLCDRGQLDRREVERKVDVAEVVHSYAAHKLLMYENTRALVALPGGPGTLDEVFELACLMQTKKVPRRPLILVGREFWQPLLDACERTMFTETRQMIRREDLSLFTVVDNELEAAAALARV